MSSGVGSQHGSKVHPSDSSTTLKLDEKLPVIQGCFKPNECEDSKSNAWEESRSLATRSLGRSVGMQVSKFTNQSSDEESDNNDNENHVKHSKGKTQTLGRKELVPGYHSKITPVSERSAAYKELVSSHQNTWKTKLSPKHSTVKHSAFPETTSSVKSRIEQNPFYQLDKQTKNQPAMSEKRRETAPSHVNTRIRDVSKDSESLVHQENSPNVLGMSVQMRIKIWSEKAKEVEKQVKVNNRKSLQLSSLIAAESKTDDEGIRGTDERNERDVQSDDEIIMNKMNTATSDDCTNSITRRHENAYEVIDDTAKEIRVNETLSSSSSSESCHGSPRTSSAKTSKANNKSPKSIKKKVKGDQSWSIWKIRSPLGKRKNKDKHSVSSGEKKSGGSKEEKAASGFNRKAIMKKKSTESSREEDHDDVFSSTCQDSSRQVNENKDSEEITTTNMTQALPEMGDQHLFNRAEILPSLFDKADSNTSSAPKEKVSISSDIRNIIDSMGGVKERYTTTTNVEEDTTVPSILEASNSDDDSDSEVDSDDQSAQSSLDMVYFGQQKAYHYRRKLSAPESLSNGRKDSFSPNEENAEGIVATQLMYADAVWDRVTVEDDELSFKVGDVIEILDMTDDKWWHGSVGESTGWFPANFVRLRVGQDLESEDVNASSNDLKESGSSTVSSDCPPPDPLRRLSDLTPAPLPSRSPIARKKQGSSMHRRMTIRRRDSTPSLPQKLSPEQIRAKIVEEIINTERVYVRHLEDIIEGFLKRCREYNKLFNEEQIELIFSNIEQVFKFQRDFLQELEARIKSDHMEQSQIGEVFVLNQHEFEIYSQYCNNHPHAVSEMNALHENEQYIYFFESCRLLRNLQDISLEGFLLTPVQKICKYPLQLSVSEMSIEPGEIWAQELLKYTSDEHPDYPHVLAAQKAMKNVAMLINEQKRRIENMGKIGCWQKTIDGWKGLDILETSTELIYSGELHKISKGHSQERHFFLFDHQLVYCKKDTIGGKLCYKGRLDLDHCQISDLTDNQAMHGSSPVKNGWRMNNKAKDNKWYIIYAKNPQEKEEWMKAFKSERERVKEDEDKGFHVSMKMKKSAFALCASDEIKKRGKGLQHRKHVVAFGESIESAVSGKQKIEGSSGSKKVAITVSGVSVSTQSKKKANKKKLNSVSGTNNSVIY